MEVLEDYRKDMIDIFKKSNMVFTDEELKNFEVTDFGFTGHFKEIGLGVLVYVSTKRVSAKEVAMLPNQICPEHKHPDFGGALGKEEMFRCRWGQVYLNVEGTPTKNVKGKIPEKFKDDFTIFHEIVLNPGDQYLVERNTWHWFQAGPEGAVLSEFSSWNRDGGDIFRYKDAKHDTDIGK